MAKAQAPARDTSPVDHGDVAGGAVVVATGAAKMRLPYPKSLGEFAGIDQRKWQVLVDTTFPGAQTVEAICMAVAYCKERSLDIFKKPIHIVPVWSSKENRLVETIWPGISEIRITASRTNAYAGKDATVFGPDKTRTFTHEHQGKKKEVTITYPEWAQVTVYRLVQGVRCPFVGPKVYWEEAYASESRFSEVPNEMWADRRSGQLEKCAEAAALRAAFPEELGSQYAAEEMHGKVVDTTGITTFGVGGSADEVQPQQPQRSDFERNRTEDTGEQKQDAPKVPEGFTPWTGAGDMIPEGPDVTVEIMTVNGVQKPHFKAKELYWTYFPGEPEKNITGYRVVVEGAKQPEPEKGGAAPAEESQQQPEAQQAEGEQVQPQAKSAFDDWYDDRVKELDTIDKIRPLSELYDSVMRELEGDDERMREFTTAFEARQDELKKAKNKK